MLATENKLVSRAEQSRAEQSRAEQSRAEQSRAEQSRAEQSRAVWVEILRVRACFCVILLHISTKGRNIQQSSLSRTGGK